MGVTSKIAKALAKAGSEAKKKEGKTFASLTKTEQNTLRRKVAGTNDADALKKQGYTTQQINTAREQIRTSKGGRGAAQLKKATERTEARKAEKAKRAEKTARETTVQTGDIGTKSVSKKPGLAQARVGGGSMADTVKNRLRETKEVAKGEYKTVDIPLRSNKPSRAQQMAEGKKPVTKSESGRKAAETRKASTERMTAAAAKATFEGDMEEFFKKLPGGKQQQLLRSANLDPNPEQRLRTLVSKEMRDAGETAASLVKNYRKGGMGTKKGIR